MRVATGNGLRPQIWEEFQSRFGIKQIGEFYGSTEGTASIINIDSTPGSCGFVSEIAPAAYPVVIFKVDPDTGELVRGADGLAVRTKPGEVGQIVGKSIKGSFFLLIFYFYATCRTLLPFPQHFLCCSVGRVPYCRVGGVSDRPPTGVLN